MAETGLAVRRPVARRASVLLRHTSWDVLTYPDLRRYLAGNVCSNLGTWLQNTAQILLAYQLTDSVLGVGLVTGAQFGSALVLTPWAGMLADRLDRRRLLIGTHLASAVAAGAMTVLQLAGALTLGPLVVGALAIGVAYTFTLPPLSAFVPTLVPPDKTREAMALNAVSFNVGRALAPVLGLGVIASVGFAWAFALNAASFIALAVVFWRLRPRAVERAQQRPRLLDGLRIALTDNRILVALGLVALVTITTDPPLVLGPSLATEAFGAPAAWSAFFLAAFGVGTLVGSSLPPGQPGTIRGWLLPAGQPSLRGTAVCLGVLGVSIMVFAKADSIVVAITAVFVAGAASLLAGSVAQTLLLALAGPQSAGRVMAVWAVAFAGSRPVATVIDTWLAGALGAETAAVLLATPAVLTGAGATVTWVYRPWRAKATGVLRGAVLPRPVAAVPAGK